MSSCRLVSLALVAAAAGCATLPERVAEPSGPPPFQGVRTLVLVRVVDDPERRPKDPLDALDESLRARGFTTRVVEVGRSVPPELREVERLHERVEARIHAAGVDRFHRRVEAIGRDIGEVVATLGADAVALYHRFEGRHPPGAYSDPRSVPGAMFPPPALDRRPLAALSLVDRAGNATWVEWGASDAELDPEVPANAVEAVDAIVAVLTGETAEE